MDEQSRHVIIFKWAEDATSNFENILSSINMISLGNSILPEDVNFNAFSNLASIDTLFLTVILIYEDFKSSFKSISAVGCNPLDKYLVNVGFQVGIVKG